jgi:hypothetical protein
LLGFGQVDPANALRPDFATLKNGNVNLKIQIKKITNVLLTQKWQQ